MNTKMIPAVLALIAGFVTCVMSFAQHVDTVIFAKRFVIVCIIFYIIGMITRIIIDMNFKEMKEEEPKADEETAEEPDENGEAEEESEQ